MSKQNDGGPAFPWESSLHTGMTLRDYFAGQTLPGIVLVCSTDNLKPHECRTQYFARKAYEVADAMLKAREVPNDA